MISCLHMGLLSGLLGNATEVEINAVEQEIAPSLIEGEKIEKAFKLIRDLFVFTNKRLILVDKQGVTGLKTEFLSIPYTDISHFAVETAGHFDMDSELKIWIRGHQEPIAKEFKKGSNLEAVHKTIAKYVLH
jgi:hypothetical protein